MSSRFCVALLAILSVVSLARTQVDQPTSPTKCTEYNQVNTTKAQCNEIFTCPGKCTGSVVAKSCRMIRPDTDFLGNPNATAPPNEVIPQVNCTITFGRNTAQAKSCDTETASYSCTGGIVPDTYALCYQCGTLQGDAGTPGGSPNKTTTPPSTAQNGSMTPDTTSTPPTTSNTTSAGNTQRIDMQQGLVLASLSLFMLSV
ncbi:uncharacterized protein MELLADRAFT_106758 [Melampsora larici-populina 98AG31]|uniref:Secreted protein n=1 Tax=Melampsora larici-populina (strain 98AG31 / pathotype 3-4-7) TaxID=747676 RepID=F4RMJ6_MELLP|nr:uncharacterized protein MELLADRAFT_106758 [Melampsora larici-populina 98AG31]EGG06436.1 secreted protein [Melampsora larici-populina 98AG31]